MSVLGLLIAAVALGFGVCSQGPQMARAGEVHRLAPFELRAVDACFYESSYGGALWPFRPRRALHAIRSGLNDPRTPVHFGNDVWASRDQQAVYAMQAGVIRHVHSDHFSVGGYRHNFSYWHVARSRGIHEGVRVRRGQLLGHIFHNYWHVHISEHTARCGTVDPQRPTGALHHPYDMHPARIGALSAYTANADAYRLPRFDTDPPSLTDPSTPLALDHLHGVVDFRAAVTHTPRALAPIDPARGVRFPEHAQAPAAIRGYLAPSRHRRRHVGHVWRFDGAHVLRADAVNRTWAFGTWRHDDCYWHWTSLTATCEQNIVWHVAGRGFDTRKVTNGTYVYCIAALTINNVPSRRCTPVTIKN
jgi:hypothetical protein